MNENELLDEHYVNGEHCDHLVFNYLLAYLRWEKISYSIYTGINYEINERIHFLNFTPKKDYNPLKHFK